MKSTTLQSNTVRPGLLRAARKAPATASWHHRKRLWSLAVLVVIVGLVGYGLLNHKPGSGVLTTFTQLPSSSKSGNVAPISKPSTAPAATVSQANECSGNTLSQFIKVSISQRHLWACQEGAVLYDSPVITGISYLAADLTPTGTYHIYAKETDLTLTGSDSTGSWSDPVSYWMPFLNNQYGTYGFHDATWRSPNDFGNISPDSSNASHGCVELPLATAKWLFDWSQIGTTLTIDS